MGTKNKAAPAPRQKSSLCLPYDGSLSFIGMFAEYERLSWLEVLVCLAVCFVARPEVLTKVPYTGTVWKVLHMLPPKLQARRVEEEEIVREQSRIVLYIWMQRAIQYAVTLIC